MLNFPSYYINLQKSKFRKKRFLSGSIDKYFSKLIRIDAIDGSQLYLNDFKETMTQRCFDSITTNTRIHKDNDMGTIGALGCYLSHICAWKLFLATEEEFCTIFEDDIHISDKECLLINDITDFEFDILLLNKNQAVKDEHFLNSNQSVVKSFTGTYAYILRRKGAQILLDHMYPIQYQVDAYISNSIKTYNLNVLNQRNIEIKHLTSFGFSTVGHWKIYKTQILISLLIVLTLFYLMNAIKNLRQQLQI